MDCKQFRDSSHDFLDNNMNDEDIQKCTEHQKSCKKCSEYIDDILLIKQTLNSIDFEPLPESFEQELHKKLVDERDDSNKYKEENNSVKKNNNKKFVFIHDFYKNKWMRYGLSTVAVLLIAVMMLGDFRMGSNMKSCNEQVMDMMYEADEEADEGYVIADDNMSEASSLVRGVETKSEDKLFGGVENVNVENSNELSEDKLIDDSYVTSRLLIKSANMTLEVENYDEVFEIIVNRVEHWGGFIESADTYQTGRKRINSENFLKEGYMSVRVPQEKFDSAIEGFATLGNQTHISISSEDVTLKYRDMVEEVENLKVREKKLRQIMEQAQTVEDTITVERELSGVRWQINSLSGSLKKWERLAAMSSIQVNINEVITLKPKIEPIDSGLGDKIKESFINNFNYMRIKTENMLIYIIAKLPFLIINIIAILIIFVILKNIFRLIIKKIKPSKNISLDNKSDDE